MKAGATLLNMEFVQFHPTGMVWPPSVKGILVTESVRGDGGVLKNSEGKRFMFDYVPASSASSTPRPRRRPTAGTPTPTTTAARRSCCPATRSPARSTPRSRPAAAPRAAASSSTSRPGCPPTRSARSCRRCTTSSRSWPTSTSRRSRWRSARPATTSWAASRSTRTPRPPWCPGLFAAGEVLRRHARLQPARRQLAVRPAGVRPPRRRWAPREYVDALGGSRPAVTDDDVEAAQTEAEAPFDRRRRREPLRDPRRPAADDERPGRHHPHARTRWSRRSSELEELKARAKKITVAGRQGLQPGLAPGARPANMLIVSECVARAALIREESRGGHTRDDFPAMSAEWRKVNLVCRADGGRRRGRAAAAAGDAARAARRCSTVTS